MTDECISLLRQRMIEDMSLRNFGEKTQKDYIRAVKNLTIFLQRSPDTASNEDLRLFQLHLTANRVGASTINGTVTALRFFFTVTLDRTDVIKHLMLVLIGGQERTETEYASLLDKAGFRLSRLVATQSPVSVVEAVLA